MGERRGLRTVAPSQANERCRRLHKTKTLFERKSQSLKPSSGDCVNRLAQLSSWRWNEVDNQMAAPAETRTPNLHRANQSAHRRVRMEGWRQWRLGGKKQRDQQIPKRIPLTPTGLLMEGDYTHDWALPHTPRPRSRSKHSRFPVTQKYGGVALLPSPYTYPVNRLDCRPHMPKMPPSRPNSSFRTWHGLFVLSVPERNWHRRVSRERCIRRRRSANLGSVRIGSSFGTMGRSTLANQDVISAI